jgi:hypothetical protein
MPAVAIIEACQRQGTGGSLAELEAAYTECLIDSSARYIQHGQQLGQADPAVNPEVAAAYIIGGLRYSIVRQLRRTSTPSAEEATRQTVAARRRHHRRLINEISRTGAAGQHPGGAHNDHSGAGAAASPPRLAATQNGRDIARRCYPVHHSALPRASQMSCI